MKISIKKASGEQLIFQVKENTVTVGRSNKCAVVVPDEALSRTHCIIESENGNFYVTDPGSANGVYLDGNRIEVNTRTAFKVFNQLYLGPMECIIEDDELELDNNPSTSQQITTVDSHAATKFKKRESHPGKEIRQRPEKSPASQKSNINLSMLAPILIMVAAGLYFYTSSEENSISGESINPTQKSQTETPAYKKQLENNRKSPDEFKLSSEYEQFSQNKTCVGFENFCNNMNLDQNQFEGIVKNENEFIVFFNSFRRQSESQYAAANQLPDINDLIALKVILSSDLLNQYFLRNINHIHLVLNDNAGKMQKVFRFHPARFTPGVAPRIELIDEISKAIKEKNSEAFWKLLRDSVPQRSLQ